MIIPRAFTVGPRRFEIKHVQALDRPPAFGRLDITNNTIKLAAKSIFEQRYPLKQRRETFWHEALHACLHDMGMPFEKHDEDFINALSKRITQICCTAEV
jgi:hypothetical protein